RVKKGDRPLSNDDIKKLHELLGFLKEDIATRIIRNIEKGDVLFISVLHDELQKLDVKELEKLGKLIGKL
ncbi:MAG: hypothetical protein ACPL0A_01060, partial [Candidatus Micrarchaeia archaeon]